MMQLLDLVIHMDAKQARQAREIINAQLRELRMSERVQEKRRPLTSAGGQP